MGYLVYKHKNFMLSYVRNWCRVQFPSLPAASVPLGQGAGLPPLAHTTHSCCYPALLQTRPAKPHVLSVRVTSLTAPPPHRSLVCTSHSVPATALHPLQMQSCWAQHSMAVWPRTVLPAAPQKDVWKTFLFLLNSKHLSHAYRSMPVAITELGSPQLWKYTYAFILVYLVVPSLFHFLMRRELVLTPLGE